MVKVPGENLPKLVELQLAVQVMFFVCSSLPSKMGLTEVGRVTDVTIRIDVK